MRLRGPAGPPGAASAASDPGTLSARPFWLPGPKAKLLPVSLNTLVPFTLKECISLWGFVSARFARLRSQFQCHPPAVSTVEPLSSGPARSSLSGRCHSL